MGFSQHAGMVIVCDGTEDADARLARVLWNDPATGVMCAMRMLSYEQANSAERHHLNFADDCLECRMARVVPPAFFLRDMQWLLM
uniref:hypothetical protein n=1 Tax=Klebsiella quasipneumoniae TaxID=1463165 RepID=UPI00389002AA